MVLCSYGRTLVESTVGCVVLCSYGRTLVESTVGCVVNDLVCSYG